MPICKVAKVEEVPIGTKKSYKASKTRVLIVNLGGILYGLQPVCTHQGNPLFTGRLEGGTLWCENHGAGFEVSTGKVVQTPLGGAHISPLLSYRVWVEGRDIIVEVPE
jgi:nitrite reductase/ring-hydroxylating ferredoxin subunit